MLRQNLENKAFPDLPDEISMAIFANLDAAQLHGMAQTCLDSYRLTKEVYQLREIEFYKEQSKQSVLWRYLDAIADPEAKSEKLTNALQTLLGGAVPAFLAQFATLSSLIDYANQLAWLSENPVDYQALQENAYLMCEYLINTNHRNRPLEISTKSEFMELMNSPEVGLGDKLAFWRSYHQLDRQLTFAMASILFAHMSTEAELLEILTNPLLMRLIKGKDLVLFDEKWHSNLLHSLITEAIRLDEKVDKTEEELGNHQVITNTLNLLTGQDLVDYFQSGEFQYKLNLFNSVFQKNHLLLIDKLSEQNLLDILNTQPDNVLDLPIGTIGNHPLADNILNSPVLLQKLSSQGLVAVLDKLALNHPEKITDYPHLTPYLTFELLQQWAASPVLHNNTRRIKAILTNSHLLQRLSSAQIVTLTKGLINSTSGAIINDNVFIERVKAERNPGQLLLAMATSNPYGVSKKISENNVLAAILAPEDVISLCRLNSLAAPIFIANQEVINKLSSTQLLTLILSDAKAAVESGCFIKLNNCDFIKFLQAKLGVTEFTDEMFDKIKVEVSKRIPQFPSLVDVLQEEIQCFQHLEKHFGGLVKLHASKEMVHAELAEVNKPKATSPRKPKLHIITQITPVRINSQPRSVKKTTSWRKIAKIVGVSLLAITGLALIATGIGSAAGVPLFASAASVLFGWMALTPAISAACSGILLTGFSLLVGTSDLMNDPSPVKKNSYTPAKQHDDRYSSTYGSIQPRLSFDQVCEYSLANKEVEEVSISPSLAPQITPVVSKKEKIDYIKQILALRDKNDAELMPALMSLSPSENGALVKQVFNYVLDNRYRNKKNQFMLRAANSLFHGMDLHKNLNILAEKYFDDSSKKATDLMSLLAWHQVGNLHDQLYIFGRQKSSTGFMYANTREYTSIWRRVMVLDDQPLLDCVDYVKSFDRRLKDYYESENKQSLSEATQQAFSQVIKATETLLLMLACLDSPAAREELKAEQLRNQQRERLKQDQQEFMQKVRDGEVSGTSEAHIRDLYPDLSDEDFSKKLMQLSKLGIMIVNPDEVDIDFAKRKAREGHRLY